MGPAQQRREWLPGQVASGGGRGGGAQHLGKGGMAPLSEQSANRAQDAEQRPQPGTRAKAWGSKRRQNKKAIYYTKQKAVNKVRDSVGIQHPSPSRRGSRLLHSFSFYPGHQSPSGRQDSGPILQPILRAPTSHHALSWQ